MEDSGEEGTLVEGFREETKQEVHRATIGENLVAESEVYAKREMLEGMDGRRKYRSGIIYEWVLQLK